MTDIIVRRGAGDLCGDDITDPLISTQAVAVNRGRNELDRRATVKVPVNLRTIFRPGVLLGQLVEVNDSLQGITYRAKVVQIRHDIEQTKATTALTVERIG